MRNLPGQAPLLLILVAFVATAQERGPFVRNIYLSGNPLREVPRVYVGGRVATVLRFQGRVDSAKTKLLGWEGRFEPLLVGGNKVVLEPLQNIASEEPFLLLVTLADGTELPFTVTAGDSERVDQQVNVFPDPESTDAIRSRLSDAHVRERRLQEENARYRKEEISVDHALAQLLANDAKQMTSFLRDKKWSLKCDGATIDVQSFTGQGKIAVVFNITNLDPATPWRMMEARLMTATTLEPRPFALRMNRTEIDPGASGRIAVVADETAFSSKKGTEQLVLELFRNDGLQVAYVVLEKRDGR
jgi:uncharacterized protein (TIGR02268 family)